MAEMNDLIGSGTLVLGRPPTGAKIVQAMFQYRLKSNDKGEPYKRKARFCARGDTYSAGPEVPIFAPTAPWVTVPCLLSLACANNYVVKTFDVKSAFTSVERMGLPDIWLATPFAPGYPDGHAFHLQKNLYGFQHSPRAFYDAFSSFLTSTLGFERCTYDKTLFRRTTALGITHISLYVDDALVVPASEEAWTELHKEVEEKYQLSSVGDATLHLGLTIDYDLHNGTLKLGNKSYIEKVAARFGIPLDVTLSSATPFARPRTRLYGAAVTGEAPVGAREQQAFWAGVGSVNWLAITNRPDLAFPISQLARFLNAPTISHTTALVHVLKYLVLTRHHTICYRRQYVINPCIRTAEKSTFVATNQLVGFCDADFANDVETRKSHTGFAFLINHAAVDWKSSHQRLVASSSTESEYLALSHCVKRAQYLRHLLNFLDQTQSTPTPILGRQRRMQLPVQQRLPRRPPEALGRAPEQRPPARRPQHHRSLLRGHCLSGGGLHDQA